MTSPAVHLFSPRLREISASRANEPPSPLLSARIATNTYLTVTTSISDQKIEAEHAEDVQPVDRERMRADEAFLHRVERRGADVAVDDADRAEHQSRAANACWLSAERRCGAAAGCAMVAMAARCGPERHKDSMWIAPRGHRATRCRLRPRRGASAGRNWRAMAGQPAAIVRELPPLRGYAEASLMVAASTLVGLAMAPRWGNSAVDLLYLPAVLGAAILARPAARRLFARLGLGAGLQFLLHRAPSARFRIAQPDRHGHGRRAVPGRAWSPASSPPRSASRRGSPQAHAARNATIAGLARRLLSCATERGDRARSRARELAAALRLQRRAGRAARPSRSCSPARRRRSRLTPERHRRRGARARHAASRPAAGVDRANHDRMAVPSGPVRRARSSRRSASRATTAPRRCGRSSCRCSTTCSTRSRWRWSARRLEARGARVRRDSGSATGSARPCSRRSAQDLEPRADGASPTPSSELRRSGSGDKALVSDIGSRSREARALSSPTSSTSAPTTTGSRSRSAASRSTSSSRTVRRDGEEVHLTPKEYAVLAELAKHPGRVLTHAHLLRTVWGPAQRSRSIICASPSARFGRSWSATRQRPH